jgi:hypothetical protein
MQFVKLMLQMALGNLQNIFDVGPHESIHCVEAALSQDQAINHFFVLLVRSLSSTQVNVFKFPDYPKDHIRACAASIDDSSVGAKEKLKVTKV